MTENKKARSIGQKVLKWWMIFSGLCTGAFIFSIIGSVIFLVITNQGDRLSNILDMNYNGPLSQKEFERAFDRNDIVEQFLEEEVTTIDGNNVEPLATFCYQAVGHRHAGNVQMVLDTGDIQPDIYEWEDPELPDMWPVGLHSFSAMDARYFQSSVPFDVDGDGSFDDNEDGLPDDLRPFVFVAFQCPEHGVYINKALDDMIQLGRHQAMMEYGLYEAITGMGADRTMIAGDLVHMQKNIYQMPDGSLFMLKDQ